ncbi:MAG: type II secretion system protein [Synergistaceae bacterium]|nr:type II secretion system protein [Synergistaceae bacterium]
MKEHKGFTLTEVLVAIAVAGLVITAGFRLIAMSSRLMGEVEAERELVTAAQRIWLKYRLDPRMPDSGKDEENENITWKTENTSIPVADYELTFKRVIVTLNSPGNQSGQRSMVIYVSDE